MILVFKTNVNTVSKVKKITPKLNKLFPKTKWNFDLEDCDNILRFETEQNIITEINILMKLVGFECEAL
jgi:hypothetical protein